MPQKGYFLKGEPLSHKVWPSSQPAEAFPAVIFTESVLMNSDDEKLLRMAKEIIVKFIELGRISPSNFETHFRTIFWALKNTVVEAQFANLPEEPEQKVKK